VKYWQIHFEMEEEEEYGKFQTQAQPFSQFIIREMLGLKRGRRR